MPPAASGGPRTPWAALGDLVLSRDPLQRLRISRSLTAMLVFAVCIGATEYAQYQGVIAEGPARWLQATLVAWVALIYGVLRSGLNRRFDDPALSLLQILGAQTWVAAAYLICHPFRGALMMLLALVLVFGIFNLTPRERRLSNIYSVVLMTAAMLLTTQIYPGSATLEIVHFVLMATILPVVTVLGAQMATTRAHLKAKKEALESALQRIQAMAIRDELTGLYNRRHMMEVLEQQIKRQERTGKPFTLCLLDLDHFKRINDTYGHGAGDEVLRHFAEISLYTLRDTDVLARWGGEEFLLMLPDTPADAGSLSIERIRKSLMHAPLVPELPELHVTFSAGMMAFQPGDDVRTAIERADRALYQAKSDGRDCTRVYA
ncbi:MAG TPA: GGDEF domain-containing protein [Candidatus Aquabacterium excrementipullorum]|nr:GGDEF domain-containing protein [Candidatus Aquabacterium excrementipullorum]